MVTRNSMHFYIASEEEEEEEEEELICLLYRYITCLDFRILHLWFVKMLPYGHILNVYVNSISQLRKARDEQTKLYMPFAWRSTTKIKVECRNSSGFRFATNNVFAIAFRIRSWTTTKVIVDRNVIDQYPRFVRGIANTTLSQTYLGA